MLTKEKTLYQVKLILDYLPEEEYNLIPKETINYIENNFEYDENIIINPALPLENQKIDDATYDILNQIIEDIKKVNGNYNVKIENIELKNVLEKLKKENLKIPQAKILLEEYRETLKQKEIEIEKLKFINEQLYDNLKRIPKLIQRVFIKNNSKLLNKK